MRTEFISNFTKNESVIQAMLERYPELERAASEMCHEFGLMVDVQKNQPSSVETICLCTKEGFYAGVLSHKTGYNRSPDKYFLYSSPYIGKERASARSDRNARDANKITGIIKALKKHKEEPTVEKASRHWANAVRYAFSTITDSSGKTSVSLEGDACLALLKLFINDDKITAEAHRNKLESTYEEYIRNINKKGEREVTLQRFQKGCTAVGILSDYTGDDCYYAVGDVIPNTKVDDIKFENLRRYNSLAESPVATEAMMLRTYAQGKSWYNAKNELGISTSMDLYIEDIDMSVGYMSNCGTWLLIPKHPA